MFQQSGKQTCVQQQHSLSVSWESDYFTVFLGIRHNKIIRAVTGNFLSNLGVLVGLINKWEHFNTLENMNKHFFQRPEVSICVAAALQHIMIINLSFYSFNPRC